ncbi:Cyclin-B1-1 [Zea mays]|uniref:Cyclin-B1-1 n=1 Tax=Zea mays TaxID=4577 RepID=A0A317YD45_MAIZE|nr:Cyclin-B1-1 [Zea mays]
MEKGILNRLEWDLIVPIVYMFFVHFLKVATLGNKVEKEMKDMALFFAELALMQYGYILVTRLSSLVAASAVYAVRLTLERAPLWTGALKHHTIVYQVLEGATHEGQRQPVFTC